MKTLLYAILVLVCGAVSASAQDTGVAPEGRLAVLSGRITDVNRDELTIQHYGDQITVQAGELTRGGTGNLNDYFDEGMFVTVEGVMEDEDEVVATRITRGAYYDYLPYLDQGNPIRLPGMQTE